MFSFKPVKFRFNQCLLEQSDERWMEGGREDTFRVVNEAPTGERKGGRVEKKQPTLGSIRPLSLCLSF